MRPLHPPLSRGHASPTHAPAGETPGVPAALDRGPRSWSDWPPLDVQPNEVGVATPKPPIFKKRSFRQQRCRCRLRSGRRDINARRCCLAACILLACVQALEAQDEGPIFALGLLGRPGVLRVDQGRGVARLRAAPRPPSASAAPSAAGSAPGQPPWRLTSLRTRGMHRAGGYATRPVRQRPRAASGLSVGPSATPAPWPPSPRLGRPLRGRRPGAPTA
jgi:hypothetical protein